MLIKGLPAFVYDIECMPNLFTVAIKNTENKKKVCYEISDRKNELGKIVSLFQYQKIFFVGYNNKHYDDLLINYCIQNFNDLNNKACFEICSDLKHLSDEIITAQNGGGASLKTLKYANTFHSLDLLAMLFSNKLRVGLKEMEVTMEYNNVREYEHDFNRNIKENDIDDLIAYNFNDVEATEELLYRCENDIKLRLAVEEEYGIQALNKDGVNLGMEILKTKYLEKTGLTGNDIKDLRSPCDVIAFKDVIFPFIEFKTKLLQDLLTELKCTTVKLDDKNAFKKNFVMGDRLYTFGVGGIHTVNKPEIYVADNQTVIEDVDVTSLYPSIIIEHEIYPPHLGKAFLEVYKQIKDERVEAKHAGNKLKDKTLKLSINGLSGNLQSEYSWCYSPMTAFRIRINGQLMLLMLAEALNEIGVNIIQVNTDGAFIKYDKSLKEKVNDICRAGEKKTKLSLEADQFEAFYQYAINDYIGVKVGYAETHNPSLIKTKGLFINEVTLGKGMAPMIIPECLIEYFVNKQSVNDTLLKCNDLRKFLTYQKVNKEFQVEYNGKPVTHINRYYMSTNGYRLTKVKDGKRIDLCASSGITIVNELDKAPCIEKAYINYQYYRTEVYKIIYALEESLNKTLF